jgi:hypothetical protein
LQSDDSQAWLWGLPTITHHFEGVYPQNPTQ